jgi:hypothetical protein
MNAADDDHEPVRDYYSGYRRSLVTTPLALAEIDHLVSRTAGPAAAAVLREQLGTGALRVEWWPSAVHATVEVAARYESLGIGLTDASLVVLAERLGTAAIGTLDERHFRRLAPLTGEPAFTLLPADAA